MSWLRCELAKERFWEQLPCNTDVEFSEFREAIGLPWYIGFYDDRLAPEKLGALIDHCSVEFMHFLLLHLQAGKTTPQHFAEVLVRVYEDMREDPDLKAYAVSFWKTKSIPLAIETYLQLVGNHALNGGKPAPRIRDGSQFALGMLLEVMSDGFGELDVNQQTYSRLWADNLTRHHSLSAILKMMEEALEGRAAWVALRMFIENAVARGEEHRLPRVLLEWYTRSSVGHPSKPEPKPVEKGRPSKLGYLIRDNEIRFTVELLHAVGLERGDGCQAVIKAFPYYKTSRRMRQICNEPYASMADIRMFMRERYRSAFDPPLPKPRFVSRRRPSS